MGTLVRGFSDEIKALQSQTVIGIPAGELLSLSMDRIGAHVDVPVRLYASSPADEYLNIGSNAVLVGDGATRITPPIDSALGVFLGGRIGFQSKTAPDTVITDGDTFTFPATTVGHYRRLVFALLGSGIVATKWSEPQAVLEDLANPGVIFSSVDGLPCGWIDLQCTDASGKFQTAGSLNPLIENEVGGVSRIYRFGAGGGGGSGGGDPSFNVQSILADGTVKIKGGSFCVYNGAALMDIATYSGSGGGSTSFKVDLDFNLSVIKSDPANNTTYYIYLDLFTLTSAPVTITETGRKVYPVTVNNLVMTTQDSSQAEACRFVYLGVVRRSVGSWDTNVRESAPTKRHMVPVGVNTSLEYTKSSTVVGTVGTLGQISAGHALTSLSFPSAIDAANKSWFNFDQDLVDDSGNGRTLGMAGGAAAAFGLGIMGFANSALVLSGTGYCNSTSPYFNPGNSDFVVGGWFYASSWAASCTLAAQTYGGLSAFELSVDGTNGLIVLTGWGASSSVILSGPCSSWSPTTWHHIVVTYIASTRTFSLYLDGILMDSQILTEDLRAASSPVFSLGGKSGGTNLIGRLDEIFFVAGSSTDDAFPDKVFASKFTHNRLLSPNDQDWVAKVRIDGSMITYKDFAVQEDYNDFFADFSKLPARAEVELRLYNKGPMGLSTAARGRELAGTASALDAILAAGPMEHLCGSTPVLTLLVDVGDGKFRQDDAGVYFLADSDYIYTSGVSLESGLGGGNVSGILRWASGGEAVVAQYRDWNTRVLSGSSILSNNDKILARPTAGTNINLDLPTYPNIGWVVKISDFSGVLSETTTVTIRANGGKTVMGGSTLIMNVTNDYVELTYNGTSDWRITG